MKGGKRHALAIGGDNRNRTDILRLQGAWSPVDLYPHILPAFDRMGTPLSEWRFKRLMTSERMEERAGTVGLEPTANGLTIRCATIAPRAEIVPTLTA